MKYELRADNATLWIWINDGFVCGLCEFLSCHSHKHFHHKSFGTSVISVYLSMSISLLLVNFDVHSNIEQKKKIFRACIFSMRRGKNRSADEKSEEYGWNDTDINIFRALGFEPLE